MNLDYLVIIAAFILGAVAVNWWTNRPDARKKPERDAAPVHEPSHVLDFPPDPAPQNDPSPNRPLRSVSALSSIPVTLALVAVCVAIAAYTRLGASISALEPFLIASPEDAGFRAILAGEVWRLLTPAFIHFGIIHLVFNMIWLWDLGALIERRKGHAFLLGFVAAVGIAANLAQFVVTGSPMFGGMSGVVYGMLGYVWMHGRVNPRFGVTLNNQTVVIMLGWFAMCWLGLLGPIANWAHTAGLLMGVALGVMRTERRGPV